jgi:hypothetical protein
VTVARAPGLFSPWPVLRRDAIVKGLVGGNRGWMAIGALVWGPVLMRRFFGRTVEIVSSEVIKPGQAVRIEAIPALTKAERRALRRAR